MSSVDPKNLDIALFVTSFYEGELDPYNPEHWAQEALATLEDELEFCALCYRDFEDEIAAYGDTVNTRRKGALKAYRLGEDDEVTDQTPTATNVPVTLDQHLHVSILLSDKAMSLSFKDLAAEYLYPQLQAQASFIDRAGIGQAAKVALGNRTGSFGTAMTVDTILEAGLAMTNRKVPRKGRYLFLNPRTEKEIKAIATFHEADKIGDEGTALRTSSVGKAFDFNMLASTNMPSIPVASRTDSTTTTLGAAAAVGDTTVTLSAVTGAAVGKFITFATGGVHAITSVGTATVGIYPAIQVAASNGSAVVIMGDSTDHLVNQSSVTRAAGGDGANAGYRAGWYGPIVWDTGTKNPVVGQLVTFGTTAPSASTKPYMIIDTDTNSFTLDRPLDAAVADNAAINLGPVGNYNLALTRQAIALVSRPLELPRAGGVQAKVLNYNGLSLRVVMDYDSKKMKHRITVDSLFGFALLDPDQIQWVVS